MGKLKVLIAFECSGKVRDAFRALGHDAYSCDIQPDDNDSQYHWQGDYGSVMDAHSDTSWDLIVMHPPCTALACSGNRWYGVGMPEHQKRLDSITETLRWYNKAKALADHVALENPVGVLTSVLSKPQYIQPWQFGHGETKRTGLWLHDLPELKPTDVVEGRENRIWRMPPSADRAKMRSETFQGIADAMAHQWSAYILGNNKQPTQTELL